MYGLATDTDLTFLLQQRLERVEAGDYQVQLHFSGSITISIEGDCLLDKKPIAYTELRELVDSEVVGVTIQANGTTNVFFTGERRLSILDSNASYESYQITAPDIYIVV